VEDQDDDHFRKLFKARQGSTPVSPASENLTAPAKKKGSGLPLALFFAGAAVVLCFKASVGGSFDRDEIGPIVGVSLLALLFFGLHIYSRRSIRQQR